MTPQITPDALTFRPRVTPTTYGDKRVFQEYKIAIFKGPLLVGMEEGPRRSTETRAEALRAARKRISALRKRRLFAIEVTKKHIEDGDARNCNTCAVSQALWHNQERMGLSKYEWAFRVSSYACFADAEGIVLHRKYLSDQETCIPVPELPKIVFGKWSLRHRRLYGEQMGIWTMQWDEWAESRYMSLREWREQHGRDTDEWPSRPGPCSFVLDLDAFVPLEL
jgi:hypothetical protein